MTKDTTPEKINTSNLLNHNEKEELPCKNGYSFRYQGIIDKNIQQLRILNKYNNPPSDWEDTYTDVLKRGPHYNYFGMFYFLNINSTSSLNAAVLDSKPMVVELANNSLSPQLAQWHSVYRFTLFYYVSYYFDTQNETKSSLLSDFREFFIYIFYPPTYITGPVHFFKHFKQKLASRNVVSIQSLFWLIFAVAKLQLISFSLYFSCTSYLSTAISVKDLPVSHGFAFIFFFLLVHYYFKGAFLLDIFQQWSFFQGFDHVPKGFAKWALLSGSIRNAWRSWNYAIHLWCNEYLYLPLGGRAYQLRNTFAIFLFMGVWHNVSMLWFHWAWVNTLALVFEAIIDHYTRHLPDWSLNFILAWKYLIAVILNLTVTQDIDQIFTFIVQMCKFENWGVLLFAITLLYLLASVSVRKNKTFQL